MAMPNRSADVRTICARYPQAFGEPMKTVDDRRRLLIPIVVRELNKRDGGQWFVLNRMDRNDNDPKAGRLTSDVIVWGPTKEHVDVLGANGPMWGPHPAITDREWLIEAWDQWPSWDGPAGSLGPGAQPTPTPPAPGATHQYSGGGHDTGTCDACGQPRGAAVHAIPSSTRPHTYDGGEQDTGLCDICGQAPGGAIHGAAPAPVDPPVPHAGTVDEKLDQLSADVKEVRDRQDRPLFPVPELKDGSQ